MTAFIGEIRIFAGNYAPAGWIFCQGQTLSIAENPQLFNIIGTTYGGDGTSTFNLPDLRGRIPLHNGSIAGQGFGLGQSGGVESVTLVVNQIPAHSHAFQATTDNADSNSPGNNLLAQPPVMEEYFATAPTTLMNAATVASSGGSQPHTNLQSYLCVNFIISLFGIAPS